MPPNSRWALEDDSFELEDINYYISSNSIKPGFAQFLCVGKLTENVDNFIFEMKQN